MTSDARPHELTAPTDDEIRRQQRDMWDTFSPGWEKWDDVVSATLGQVGDALVRIIHPRDDQQHLDVAAGTGEPGLTVAALAPKGRVTLTDLSPSMLAAAGRRAAAKGLDNIELCECSADDLPYPDATFDSVSCRFGFMFFPDLRQAASELVRVLRPGGRIAAAVWAGPEANLWATIPGDAIATEVALPAPSPGAPGMFRCATPGMLASVLEGVGVRDIVEWEVPTVLTVDRPEAYWQLLTDCTAPVVAVLEQVDDGQRRRIASKVIDTARAFESGGSVRLPGTARCIVGTRP